MSHTFKGGVHPNYMKAPEVPMTVIAPPPQVVIPMAQHIGAPCKPTVVVGDYVTMGQVVGTNPAPVSAAGFSDVADGAWYAGAVRWAADSGIVAGYDDGTFRPEKTLTREQMAVMLARYYARSGVTMQGSLDFADAAKISGWAVDGVSVCVGLGLVQGDPRGRFLPQSRLTRAQIASILVRMAG